MQNDSFSDNKVSLTLGDQTYLLIFGLQTLRRIEEDVPGFSIVGGNTPAFEILPILIRNAIPPDKRPWKTDDEFAELYDACTDEDNLALVLLAYQNAMGFIDRRFEPMMGRLREQIDQLSREDEKKKAKK